MTLTIDQKTAILKSGTSIKYTSTNPVFEEAGDYTLEVTLPLSGCPENQRIFGALHRPETPLTPLIGRRLPFTLLAPPLSVEGTAVVLSVTQEEAKVQLLARGSALKLDETLTDGGDIYIDEMDLGKAYEDVYPDAYASSDRDWFGNRDEEEEQMPDKIRAALVNGIYLDQEERTYIRYGLPEETECVNFPVYSEGDESQANDREYVIITDRSDESYRRETYNYKEYSKPSVGWSNIFAAQPYLNVIIERVITALGYTIRRNDIRGTWMERIFIANGRSEYEYANILPHWTVEEFLTEVRNFFGIVIAVEGKNVDIIRRADYYADAGNTIHLAEVIDEHTAEMDEDDEGNDTTAASVAYNLPDGDSMTTLPDEVWENAIILHFSSETIMVQWISQNLNDTQKAASAYLFVLDDTGRVYAHLRNNNDEWGLAEVDFCPPLIRQPGEQYGSHHRDIGVSLSIVPARMTYQPLYCTLQQLQGRYPVKIGEVNISIPMLTTSQSVRPQLTAYNINDVINPDNASDEAETTTTEKPEIIEVAYNPGTNWNSSATTVSWQTDPFTLSVPSPLGIAYLKHPDTGLYTPIVQTGNHDQFRLTATHPDTLTPTALTPGFSIDTRLQHTFTFADRGVFPVSSIYIIRGRRYACLRLEYTIDERGLKPTVRGTFYELN